MQTILITMICNVPVHSPTVHSRMCACDSYLVEESQRWCMHAGAGARSGKLKDAAYGMLYALDDITHAAAQARARLDAFIAAAGAVPA